MNLTGPNFFRLLGARAILWLAVWGVAVGLIWMETSRRLAHADGPPPPPPTATAKDSKDAKESMPPPLPPGEAKEAPAKEPTAKQAAAKDAPGSSMTPTEAQRLAEAALAEGDQKAGVSTPPPALQAEMSEINIFQLAMEGRPPMWAIGVVSIVAVAFAIERILGLRRSKVMPPEFIARLGRATQSKGPFDPREIYKLCQQFPSTAATVVGAMLLKVGRPLAEAERAVDEATDREANRLYANVRWQTLAFNVAPMLGLLGTVQGMIIAFYKTSHLHAGASRAESLAAGIYEALVCTFAGLLVAIPAGIMAHYFEGRIQKLLRELEDVVLAILPQLERYEGRQRVTKEQLEQPDAKPRGTPENTVEKRPAVTP